MFFIIEYYLGCESCGNPFGTFDIKFDWGHSSSISLVCPVGSAIVRVPNLFEWNNHNGLNQRQILDGDCSFYKGSESLVCIYYIYLLHNGATGQKKISWNQMNEFHGIFFVCNFNIFWNWPSINDIIHSRGRSDLSKGDDTPQVYLVKWVTREG